MDSKTAIALAKLAGDRRKIDYMINCFEKSCPHCKTLLKHKNHFIQNSKILAIGYCSKCGYEDPIVPPIHMIRQCEE